MELDVFKVLLSHLQHIVGVSEEHVSSVAVLCHILVLALLESLEFGFVVALNPASLVETYRFPAALCIIFVLESVLDDLKLKLSYRTDEFPSVELVDEQLSHTFVHQLVDTLFRKR